MAVRRRGGEVEQRRGGEAEVAEGRSRGRGSESLSGKSAAASVAGAGVNPETQVDRDEELSYHADEVRMRTHTRLNRVRVHGPAK